MDSNTNTNTMISTAPLSDKANEIINNLIEINNDRYDGYVMAAKETNDEDLKDMFSRLGVQSLRFTAELKKLIPSPNLYGDGEMSVSVNLYRACIYVKASAAKNDRKAVLSSCEFGEDFALHTYESALKLNEIPEQIRATVSKQKICLDEAYQAIKSLKDVA